ncbi:MAG: polysaccharide biosynthesis tyrosine autokinase [Armatimonadota bacterium]|nr:polysaccharide biosynthesis tyrosine autokinase [Armatimonadota bacterium]
MDTAQEPTLRDYLELALRRWWLIAACVAAALGVALGLSLGAPRVYRGTATLVVDRASSSLGLTADITGISQQAFVDTLAEIVKSRAVAERALARLRVTADREKALAALQEGLRVQRVRGADLIRIQAEGPTPEEAATNTNAVALGFMDWHLQSRRAQAAAGREFIEQQLTLIRPELQQAEDALAAYKAAQGQVSLSEQTTFTVEKLADFEAQRRAAAAERQAIEASLRRAREELSGQQPTVPSSFVRSEDPVVSQLRQDLTKLEVELAGLRQQFTDRHPQIIATLARINEVKARLRRLTAERVASTTVTLNPLHQSLAGQIISLEVDREAARAKEIALGGIVQRYVRDARAVPSNEVQLARLTRDVKVAEQTYLLLSQKLQEARIAEASIVGDLRFLDRATPPAAPVSPRTRLNALFGTLLGLMVGVAAVLTLESIDTTIKTPEEAEQVLGLPVLATIPRWEVHDRKKGAVEIMLATSEHRRAPFAEAFRHLRTSLLYLSPDRPLRTVQVTSPGPDEGKSTVAANLAVAMAQTGRKVILLEGDLRKPTLSWAFQPRGTAGLSDLLMDGMTPGQSVHQTKIENLSFVPSGTKPPNPAELLGSQKMRALLAEQMNGAQFVVLDTPPVLPVADAAVVAPAVDGVILVVMLERTPRDAARRARQQLEAVGAKVVGIVANGVLSTRRGYYQYYSHYYQSDDVEDATAGKTSVRAKA